MAMLVELEEIVRSRAGAAAADERPREAGEEIDRNEIGAPFAQRLVERHGEEDRPGKGSVEEHGPELGPAVARRDDVPEVMREEPVAGQDFAGDDDGRSARRAHRGKSHEPLAIRYREMDRHREDRGERLRFHEEPEQREQRRGDCAADGGLAEQHLDPAKHERQRQEVWPQEAGEVASLDEAEKDGGGGEGGPSVAADPCDAVEGNQRPEERGEAHRTPDAETETEHPGERGDERGVERRIGEVRAGKHLDVAVDRLALQDEAGGIEDAPFRPFDRIGGADEREGEREPEGRHRTHRVADERRNGTSRGHAAVPCSPVGSHEATKSRLVREERREDRALDPAGSDPVLLGGGAARGQTAGSAGRGPGAARPRRRAVVAGHPRGRHARPRSRL